LTFRPTFHNTPSVATFLTCGVDRYVANLSLNMSEKYVNRSVSDTSMTTTRWLTFLDHSVYLTC